MTANSTYPELDRERVIVVENIARAVEEGDLFRKVEPGDPTVTAEDVKRVIAPFDNLRRKPRNRLLARVARAIAERETKKRLGAIELVGVENARSIIGGAIITSNHFNYMDNIPPRILAMECGRRKKFHIVVQQTNIFMKGYFGFLMRHCNTLPVSDSPSYMAKNMKPALRELLGRGDFVLIYPEQEMWYNYKKPRELREGAYYYACEFDVPVIPCFTEMRECEGFDALGFRNVRYILHVMPPIYPDKTLDPRQRREKMRQEDALAKRECYKRIYGEYPADKFDPVRDIAGYNNCSDDEW